MSRAKHEPLRVIILSGGEGERLKPFILRRFGRNVPKQYCAFLGGRSMLRHTVERALSLADQDRIFTVIGKDHRRFLEPHTGPLPGIVLEQPKNLDTGPGIFLPISRIILTEPDTTLVILPSDHFISPNDLFVRRVREACSLAQRFPDLVFLLAAAPDAPETDYGWIAPGQVLHPQSGARRVASFHEKPDSNTARNLYRAGGLWNTMILVGKAAAFWELGSNLCPDILDDLGSLSGEAPSLSQLQDAYANMSPCNFSGAVLEKAAHRIATVPMTGVQWQDWGREERLLCGLSRFTKSHLGRLAESLRDIKELAPKQEITYAENIAPKAVAD